MKELFIFDMDGLVLDTEKIYYRCWFDVVRHFSLAMNEKDVEATIGMSSKLEIDYFKRFTDIPFDTLMDEREKRFWSIVEQEGIKVKDGVVDTLRILKDKGLKTVILTSTHQDRALHLLELSKLTHEFEYQVFGDMVEHSKPAPDQYRLLETMTTIDPSKWIAFEDSYNGIKAANNAGVDVIWVKDLVDIRGRDAHYLKAFDSFDEVKKTILAD